jgi:hypothetical protein
MGVALQSIRCAFSVLSQIELVSWWVGGCCCVFRCRWLADMEGVDVVQWAEATKQHEVQRDWPNGGRRHCFVVS